MAGGLIPHLALPSPSYRFVRPSVGHVKRVYGHYSTAESAPPWLQAGRVRGIFDPNSNRRQPETERFSPATGEAAANRGSIGCCTFTPFARGRRSACSTRLEERVPHVRWIEPEPLPADAPVLHGDPLVSALLYRRGLSTADAAAAFLDRRARPIPDPFGLPNMAAAVRRVCHAVACS